MILNTFIGNLFQIILFHYFISTFLEIKQKKIYLFIFYVVEIISLVFATIFCSIAYSSILFYILDIVVIFIFFRANFLNKFIYVGTFLVTATISEMLVMNCLTIFFSQSLIRDTASSYFLIGSLCSGIIEFSLIYILIKFIKINQKVILPKYFWLILILPVFTVFLLQTIKDYALNSDANQINSLVLCVGLLTANYGTLYISSITIENLDAKYKMEIAQDKEKLIKLNYGIFIKQNNHNYKVLHDTRSKLNKILDYANQKDFLKLSEYTYKMYKDVTRDLTYTFTDIPVFNVLLDDMIDEIYKNDVRLKIQFKIHDFDFIDLYDQMILFGNILKISINNCINNQNENKFIIIKTAKINNQIHLVTNISVNHEIKNDQLFKDLSAIIKKYHGVLTIDTRNQISCKIILAFPEKLENETL